MRRRLVAVAATALLPAVAMLVYNEVLSRQQRDAEIHRQALQAARQASSEVERITEGMHNLLIAASAIPAVSGLAGPACTEALTRVAEKMFSIRTIIVLDVKGKLVCDSMGTPAGMDFSDRSYFADALATNDFVVGEYTRSRLTDTAILPVAMPLDRNGVVTGVIVTGVRLEWLNQRIRDRGLLPGGTVTVADRNGMIIARNPDSTRFVGTAIPEPFRRLVTASEPGTVEAVSQDGTTRILGYEPVTPGSRPLYVSAGISKDEAFAAINQTTVAGLAFIVIGAALAILAAVFVGNRFILMPIHRIVGVLDRWRAGDLPARTRMRGRHGELGLVGASIDELLDELDGRRRQAEQSETSRSLLVRELSHRVKNTLSIVQAIARQTFGRRTADEFNSFSQRLGALAGAYDVLLAEQWESGDLREVVGRALKPHHNEADERILLQGDTCQLPSQAVLSLSMVVHELATNATKYGALSTEQGTIQIGWRREGERIAFDWREEGGPVLDLPEHEGFGSRLIRSAFPADFEPQALFRYEPSGLDFSLTFHLRSGH